MTSAETPLPTIDIIILAWNRTQTTLEAIDSVLAQKGVQTEIYVFDQGSDEASLVALRERAERGEIHLIEHGQNIGPGAGRNIAMSHGTGEFIVGIDNDAEFADETTLAKAIERFENDTELGLIGFRIVNYTTGENDMHSLATYPRDLQAQLDQEFYTSRYVACGHAIRRSAYEQTKGYDDALFFMCEERDLAYQIINAGYTIIYTPDVIVRHKISPEARYWWQSDRYYYLARNAIYLDYKYYQQAQRTFVLFAGYIVRGLYNRVFMQGIRGVMSAMQMIWQLDDDTRVTLSSRAKDYIWEHDGRFRGNILQRARRDLFQMLVPATENETQQT